MAARRPGTAGADDDDVVLVALEVGHVRASRRAGRSHGGQPTNRRSVIVPAATQRDVGVGDHQRRQGDPGQPMWWPLSLRHLAPQPVAHRVLGEVVEPAADDVAAGVARDRVGPEQHDVGQQDQVAEADAEPTALAVEGDDRVLGVDQRDQRRRRRRSSGGRSAGSAGTGSRRCSVACGSATAQAGGDSQNER